jgi:hypothetical protein
LSSFDKTSEKKDELSTDIFECVNCKQTWHPNGNTNQLGLIEVTAAVGGIIKVLVKEAVPTSQPTMRTALEHLLLHFSYRQRQNVQ